MIRLFRSSLYRALKSKIFFACRPDLPDDGKDVRNAIQAVVDAWLIFDKRDGGA